VSPQRATDTLANERTFLAYVRTALAFVAFGFVIARFSLFTRELAALTHIHAASSTMSLAFGTFMALTGVACGGYGAYRYVAGARALRADTVSPMPDGVAVAIGLLIGTIGFIVTWTLYASR
jgi:putative membrane protein